MKGLLCLLCSLALDYSLAADWGYDQQGNDWPDSYEMCYDGGYSHQTPINIVTGEAVRNDLLVPFQFSSSWLDDVADGLISNNGHTFQFSDNDGTRKVSGGGLDGTYTFLQVHFHYGSSDSYGSEHFRDGFQYPAEVHFVTINNAFQTGQVGRLAVLGFFIEIGERDSELFGPIISQISEVQDYNTANNASKDNVINFGALTRLDLDHYFRYYGSLTTPPCSPVVVWTMFKKPLYISESQYDQLLTMTDGDGVAIENNFRRLMPLNDRVVYYSPGTRSEGDGNSGDGYKYALTAIFCLIGGAAICFIIVAVVFLIYPKFAKGNKIMTSE